MTGSAYLPDYLEVESNVADYRIVLLVAVAAVLKLMKLYNHL